MLLKINGVPIDELVKEGIDVGLNFQDAFHLIHTPINLDVGLSSHHWFTADMNFFNIPIHTFHFVKPHVQTALDFIF